MGFLRRFLDGGRFVLVVDFVVAIFFSTCCVRNWMLGLSALFVYSCKKERTREEAAARMVRWAGLRSQLHSLYCSCLWRRIPTSGIRGGCC